MEAGRFRRELFYRLSTIILTIPPLKDRGEDVLLIAEHYDRKISIDSGRDLLCLGPEVQDALMDHHWPGNVRELRNLMAGLHCLAKSRTLTLEDLPPETTGAPLPRNPDANAAPNQRQSSAASLKHAEVLLIESALQRHNGNLSKAAIALGISRPTLYRKIQTYGIRTP